MKNSFYRKRKISKKKTDLPMIAPPTVLKGNKPKDKASVKNLGDKKVVRKSLSGGGAKSVCDPHFKCNYCDASFVRKDSLQSHLRQHIKQQQQHQTSASSGRQVYLLYCKMLIVLMIDLGLSR